MNSTFFNFTNKCTECLTCTAYMLGCDGTSNPNEAHSCRSYEFDLNAYLRQYKDTTYADPNMNDTYDDQKTIETKSKDSIEIPLDVIKMTEMCAENMPHCEFEHESEAEYNEEWLKVQLLKFYIMGRLNQ